MEALRVRLGSVVEWVIAAAFLAATVAVGSLILQDIRVPTVRASTSVPGRMPVSSMPAAVPSGAVSVPVLPFQDGKEVRIGEDASEVALTLGRAAETGRQDVDGGALGDRVTRFYEYGGFRFILVYEPFERHGTMRVGSIYLP